jgi:hypothetical protein
MANRTWSRIPSHYVGMWALLMTLSIAYIGAMSISPDLVTSAVPTVKIGAVLLDEDDREIRTAAAEAETLRRQLFSARAELNAMRGELARRSDRETTLVLKLAALEARDAKAAETAAITEAALPKTAAATPKQPEKPRTPKPPGLSAVERLANSGGPATPAGTTGPPGPIETGSVAPQSRGEGGAAGIQLGTGPSVDALRLNWTLLSQRHQGLLQRLQPRYTAARGATGAYDLIAGPVPNAGDAERICDALRAQNVSCKVGAFGGNAL